MPRKPKPQGPPSQYGATHGPPAPPEVGEQGRLFAQPETTWQKRAAIERLPAPRQSWAEVRPHAQALNPQGHRRGVTKPDVNALLREQGVTAQGAQSRLISTYHRAVERGGGTPQGFGFYAHEQPNRFEEDAKRFNLPYHVVVAVNAVTSPKTALATNQGYQTNREAAYRIMEHVTSGKRGVPKVRTAALRANIAKGTGIVRAYMKSGTHPLDATDKRGKPLLSGPKVEQYYSNYMNPHRTTTDIQHARVLFGPSVRSTLSEEENVQKNKLIEQHGKDSPEVGRYIPKTPVESLLEHAGVHAWAAHQTEQAAKKLNITPAELQTSVWHQVKFERGEAHPPEVKALFADRRKPKKGGRQGQLPGLRNV